MSERKISREQLLIDIMFSVAMRIHARDRVPESREELAEWIRYNLKECGFPTHPQGMSWAVLE